jgi:hypothetical protein
VRLYFIDEKLMSVTVCFSSDEDVIMRGLEAKYGRYKFVHNSPNFSTPFFLYVTDDIYVVYSTRQVTYFDKLKYDAAVQSDINEQLKLDKVYF